MSASTNRIDLPEDYQKILGRALKNARENKQFLLALKRKPIRKLDTVFHQLHEEVFGRIDCLQCANCCKTTSPIFYDKDIDRLARRLRMKSIKFIETYLKVDEDGDYVLQKSPCVFLSEDNYCQVYEDRPTACREYPHTDRKRMEQILDITYHNTLVCPAVAEIIDSLKRLPQ
jgi:uncharacterized protein